MTTDDNSPPVINFEPFDPSQPPDCVTQHELGNSLVIRYQDRTLGFALLSLPAMYFITIIGYTISVGGVPVSELIGAGILGLGVLLIPVSMIVNATLITVNEQELIVTRGPLSLSRTKKLLAVEIENLHVKAWVGQKSGMSFHLRASLHGEDKPKVLIRLNRDHEPGYYVGNLIYGKLGLHGEVGFVGGGNRRGPVRPRPF